MKNILITGINGQDGVILTSKLLNVSKDIKILGTSRTPDLSSFTNKLNIFNEPKNLDNLEIVDIDFFNTIELESLVKNFKPDIVFNLMGPSNVNQSIGQEDYYLRHIYLSFKCLVNQLSKIDKKLNFSSFFF